MLLLCQFTICGFVVIKDLLKPISSIIAPENLSLKKKKKTDKLKKKIVLIAFENLKLVKHNIANTGVHSQINICGFLSSRASTTVRDLRQGTDGHWTFNDSACPCVSAF